MKLFLDDTREVRDCIDYMHIKEGSKYRDLYLEDDWILVRNYNDFIEIIENSGLPSFISFDHDLGEDEARHFVDLGMFSKRAARRNKKLVKSGYDCAKWLVKYCMKTKLKLPEYYVHSMNPVGKENIESLLKNYSKNQIDE